MYNTYDIWAVVYTVLRHFGKDVAGVDGSGLLQTIVQQASQAPGWVEYNISNPITGRVQTKMSYVLAVDDLYVGCGVYKTLLQAG